MLRINQAELLLLVPASCFLIPRPITNHVVEEIAQTTLRNICYLTEDILFHIM